MSSDLSNIPLQEMQLAPIYGVPKEIILHIFGFLSKEDLGKAVQVCKIWNNWVSDNIFLKDCKTLKIKNLTVIDKSDWKTFLGVDIKDEPPLDKRDILVLKKLIFSLEGKIEGDAGLTLITIPKTLDLNHCLELARNPKQGNVTKCQYMAQDIIKEFGNKSISKTIRVVITNNILKGSRNKSVEQQKNLTENLGLEMSELLPTIALIFMTYISSQEKSPTRLFNDNPYTYTRLKEEIEKWHLAVGGFAPTGLYVNVHSIDFDYYGVGGLRKF